MRKILVVLMSIIFIPLSITNFFYVKKEKINAGLVENNEEKKMIRVLKSDNTVENIELEEYLIGVVSAEMPASFEKEALKAQAVAARTYALKKISESASLSYDVTDNTNTQVYQTNEQLRNKWQDKYDEYYEKIKSCINETKGEYLTYNDEIIYAFFFSTSNGKTEDNKDVFGKDLPYLKIVDSSFDEIEASNFYDEKRYSLEDFYEKLGLEYNEKLNIENIIYTESNRIKSIEINKTIMTGRDFQKKLSLRSNDFTVSKSENTVIIKTKGYGHGVGMSQYGANALAKQNKNYMDILNYYYQGTTLKKI